jgi:hypothetical protein
MTDTGVRQIIRPRGSDHGAAVKWVGKVIDTTFWLCAVAHATAPEHPTKRPVRLRVVNARPVEPSTGKGVCWCDDVEFAHTVLQNPLPFMPELLAHLPPLPGIPRSVLLECILVHSDHVAPIAVMQLVHSLAVNAMHLDGYIVGAVEAVVRERFQEMGLVECDRGRRRCRTRGGYDKHGVVVHALEFLQLAVLRKTIPKVIKELERRDVFLPGEARFIPIDAPLSPSRTTHVR